MQLFLLMNLLQPYLNCFVKFIVIVSIKKNNQHFLSITKLHIEYVTLYGFNLYIYI
jgi:hypothetical protein